MCKTITKLILLVSFAFLVPQLCSAQAVPPGWTEQGYVMQYPDVADAISKGLVPNGWFHYFYYGKYEGRLIVWAGPGWLFPVVPKNWDEAAYLTRNPDVKAAIPSWFNNGFSHWVLFGRTENRTGAPPPPPDWNEELYLNTHPDVKGCVARREFNSGWEYYWIFLFTPPASTASSTASVTTASSTSDTSSGTSTLASTTTTASTTGTTDTDTTVSSPDDAVTK